MERYHTLTFCERAIKGIDESVEKARTLYVPIDLQCLGIDENNLEQMLKKISQELFREKTPSIGHVYAFVVFCVHLHEYLSSQKWYCKENLVRILANILLSISFRPVTLVKR